MHSHPEHDLLEQYAAATLPLPIALCVSVHLEFCAQCRGELRALQSLGGLLFEQLEPVPVDAALLQSVLRRLDQPQSAQPSATAPVQAENAAASVPRPLRALLPGGYAGLRWSTILPGLRVSKLDVGAGDYHVALHRIKPGAKVGMHDHRGLEITQVLTGSFSDEYGVYGDGDFILREPGMQHRPLAAQNEECICLALQAAPVRFTGPFWRLLNPFLR